MQHWYIYHFLLMLYVWYTKVKFKNVGSSNIFLISVKYEAYWPESWVYLEQKQLTDFAWMMCIFTIFLKTFGDPTLKMYFCVADIFSYNIIRVHTKSLNSRIAWKSPWVSKLASNSWKSRWILQSFVICPGKVLEYLKHLCIFNYFFMEQQISSNKCCNFKWLGKNEISWKNPWMLS